MCKNQLSLLLVDTILSLIFTDFLRLFFRFSRDFGKFRFYENLKNRVYREEKEREREREEERIV